MVSMLTVPPPPLPTVEEACLDYHPDRVIVFVRLGGEIFTSKNNQTLRKSNGKFGRLGFYTIANPLMSISGDFLEERLWTWGVSRPILTPQGLSSKAATNQRSGWTRPKNSSAVTSRLSGRKRLRFAECKKLGALELLLLFSGKCGWLLLHMDTQWAVSSPPAEAVGHCEAASAI